MKLRLPFFLSFVAVLASLSTSLGAAEVATSVSFSVTGLTINNARVVAVPRVKVSIVDATIGTDTIYRRYEPGGTSYSSLVLERPYPADNTWKVWFDAAASGQDVRKDITVTYRGTGPLLTVIWKDCLPKAHEIVIGLNGSLTERLEIRVGSLQ